MNSKNTFDFNFDKTDQHEDRRYYFCQNYYFYRKAFK